ncbi:MAG: bifunctional glutamate N-acetyltransferase/amino-acid acetyltransferase ArgJ [Lentisphaerae bacterium]|nr:MAG: bifunctional glutamate N-acetyltransferase/amino-acid acetyltransferase ArgJ [Lentisphaerota bacterium]
MQSRLSWDHEGGVCSVPGFKAGICASGIKESGNPDLLLLYSEQPAQFACMFTDNAFAAAPVHYCREIAAQRESVHGVIVNSGNANACTGLQGQRDVRKTAQHVADRLGCEADEFFVCSTGKIGIPLPMDRVLAGLDQCMDGLDHVHDNRAVAEAIMTTDTQPKHTAVKCHIDTHEVTIGAIAKGAGMIYPQMKQPDQLHATLLAFITTDAVFEPGVLQKALREAVDQSFNRISIDGDTSTNDSVICLANGAAGIPPIRDNTIEYEVFRDALTELCIHMAKWLVRDGEGATKLVFLQVRGAATPHDAEIITRAIANSLLCKTAWFGGDPNWGRIIDAAGYSGARIVPGQVELRIQDVCVMGHGTPLDYNQIELDEKMQEPELTIELDLNIGDAHYHMWTCDISYEYVKINAEYHT